MSYHRRRGLGFIEPHGPLAPPPGATSERLITTSTAASGNVNRVTCEGAGGVYTEHCPSMAQVGVVGPYPTAPGVPAFQPPCVAYCEMPEEGKAAWTGEDPYNRWSPKQPGMLGFGESPLQALRARRASMYRQNPYFKRTGMVSHRHPFHGYGEDATGEAAKMYSSASPTTDAIDVYDLYVGQFDKRYVGVQGFGGCVGCGLGEDSLVDTLGAPALRGVITGLAAYGVASAVGVDSAKAKRLGFVMGGLDVAVSVLSKFIKKAAGTSGS